jgi:rare lipoprotein A
MRRHYEVALIAASAMLTTAQQGAWARSASRHHRQPAPAVHPHTAGWVGESGEASYYSNFYHGRRAANGSRFDQRLLTAAHAWLPFGTQLRVTSASTGQSVIVTVTDRIYNARRVIDLSVAAARAIGIIHHGVGEVSLAPA